MEIISKQTFEFQRETLDNARMMGHDRGSKSAADLAKGTYEEITWWYELLRDSQVVGLCLEEPNVACI